LSKRREPFEIAARPEILQHYLNTNYENLNEEKLDQIRIRMHNVVIDLIQELGFLVLPQARKTEPTACSGQLSWIIHSLKHPDIFCHDQNASQQKASKPNQKTITGL
jgi:hypothetical protein